MNSAKKLFWLSLPVALATGCAHHRPETVVYTQPPVVAVAPTSSRPVERVYPDTATLVRGPVINTASASPASVAAADNIRRLFEADPALASSGQGVRISVLDNRIIMTGFVLTEEDRRTLHRAIHDMPGVRHDFGVDDRVQVE
jgi:hypothetical protein